MATFTDGPRHSFKTTTDLSAKKYHIMKQTADDTVAIADGPTAKLVGVLYNTPVAGELASVHRLNAQDSFLVKAGGDISYGQQLTSNTDGEAVATTTEDDVVIGIALKDAVDGDIVEYAPLYYKVAPAS